MLQAFTNYGYLIVFLGALGENTALLGLVMPGGTLTLLGAFYARQGTLNLVWVIFFAWIGTVLGYNADYLLGRFALTPIMARWGKSAVGRRLRVATRLRRGEQMLTRYGGRAILLSHVIGMGYIRSFVAVSAGASHMRYRRFLAFELVAALLRNIGFGVLGYLVGAGYDRITQLVGQAGWIIVGIAVLAILIWNVGLLWLRKWRHTHHRHNAMSESAD